MIVVRAKFLETNINRAAAGVERAIAFGMTRGGNVVRTQVRKELSSTTGLKTGRVNELTPSKSAAPGNLRYEIHGLPYQNDARYLKSKPRLKITSPARTIYRNMGAGDAHHKFAIGASGSLSATLWSAKQWGRAKSSEVPGGAKLRRDASGKSRWRQIYAANIAHEIAGSNPKTGDRIQVLFRDRAETEVPPRVIEQMKRVLG
jgi:hypothetical protein